MHRDDTLTDRGLQQGAFLAALMAFGVLLTLLGVGWRLLPRSVGEAVERSAGDVVATFALVSGLIVFTVGLGAYVLGPAFRGRDAAWQDVGSHQLVLSSTLLVITLGYLGPIIYALIRPSDGLCTVPGFLGAALSVSLALLLVTYLRFIRPGVLTSAGLGLRRARLVGDVGKGVLVYGLVLIASATMQTMLTYLGVRQTQLQGFACVREFPLPGFLAVMVAAGVLAPIAEELFFRGFVFQSYLRTRGPAVAYVLSSLLFATLHLNLPALLPILVLALTLSWAYHRTGSIVPSVVAHALNNSIALLALYFVNLSP